MASKGVKRIREDASQLSGIQDSLANALKENEELKANAEKLQRESTDDKKLLDERQAQLEKLNARIAELGGEQQQFNFSNAAAREVAPPAEPAAAIKPEAGLTAVAAQALQGRGQPARGGLPLLLHLQQRRRLPAHGREQHQPRAPRQRGRARHCLHPALGQAVDVLSRSARRRGASRGAS